MPASLPADALMPSLESQQPPGRTYPHFALALTQLQGTLNVVI
jgi:hypothetical protein